MRPGNPRKPIVDMVTAFTPALSGTFNISNTVLIIRIATIPHIARTQTVPSQRLCVLYR